ncbi:hypothetical protein KSD_95540 [Ktedonobacter sp. SOSP1-85]|nr:hypothetical protein KSD_95540 [Ktedonobacter sp. SOSP1-85]
MNAHLLLGNSRCVRESRVSKALTQFGVCERWLLEKAVAPRTNVAI